MSQVADEVLDRSDAEELEQLRAAVAAGEQSRTPGNRVRSVIVALLAVNCILLTFVIVGALGDTGDSPTPATDTPLLEDSTAAAVAQAASSTATASRPVSSGRSAGSLSGGRSAPELYTLTGGLEDIFCRVREGESEETWRGRVADYCER
jgi:hypothetical protein